MSITQTKEKHFIVLLSIFDLNGSATKQKVLDNIEAQSYYKFSSKDLAMKSNRKELHWRNDLAFIRKYLVDKGYIDDSVHNQWSITNTGVEYLNLLSHAILSSKEFEFQKLTAHATQKASEILDENDDELEKLQAEFSEDNNEPPNETQEALIKRIKRYQIIVKKLKTKYNGCCQIENCGFTFLKKNGENYAEGHHLIPLAKGGGQNPDNVVILCANHHRMLHYAKVEIGQMQSNKHRSIMINGVESNIIYED